MKVVLITGAASGLGKAFATLYASKHQPLVLVDKNDAGLMQTKNELEALVNDIYIDCIEANLSYEEELQKVFQYTQNKDYFVCELINCAGFGDCTDFWKMDIQKQLQMTKVDCNALLYFTRVYLDDMIRHNEGHIINISSLAGFLPGPYMSTYHACKGYILLLGEAIAYELRKTNVHLLTLCPGPFHSNFVHFAHNDYTFQKIKPIDANRVALIGYQKAHQGKNIAIVGLKNRLTIFLTRFLPRRLIISLSSKMIKKEK